MPACFSLLCPSRVSPTLPQEQISLPGRVPGPCPKVIDEGLVTQQAFRKLPAGRASRFLAMQKEALRLSGRSNPAIPESLELELTQADANAVAKDALILDDDATDQNLEEEGEEESEMDGELTFQPAGSCAPTSSCLCSMS